VCGGTSPTVCGSRILSATYGTQVRSTVPPGFLVTPRPGRYLLGPRAAGFASCLSKSSVSRRLISGLFAGEAFEFFSVVLLREGADGEP